MDVIEKMPEEYVARLRALWSKLLACPAEEARDTVRVATMCAHRFRVQRRTASNGTVMFCRQCETCGNQTAWIGRAKLTADEMAAARELRDHDDPAFADWLNFERTAWELYQARTGPGRAMEYEARRNAYHEWLKTVDWKEVRRKRLEMDGYVCQGCGVARAEQVHHITYSHATSPFLFQLVSLCRECHERYHAVQDTGAACDTSA